MSCLQTTLKLFYFLDEEHSYILAENEEQAREFYENELLDDEQKRMMIEDCGSVREAYKVQELDKNTDVNIALNCGAEKELVSLAEKAGKWEYNGRLYAVNVWILVKYLLLEDEIFDREHKTPMLIASSVF